MKVEIGKKNTVPIVYCIDELGLFSDADGNPLTGALLQEKSLQFGQLLKQRLKQRD